jgi:hypothetical protein
MAAVPSSSSIPRNAPSVTAVAFEKVVKAISPDIPLLMHGSGDVVPQEVNLDTAGLVAELTAQYIARLVDAAVEAHHTLTDNGKGGILPPPSRQYRTPLVPPMMMDQINNNNNTSTITTTAAADSTTMKTTQQQRKRRKAGIEYWDDPIPVPEIHNSTTTATDFEKLSSRNSSSKSDMTADRCWVGVAGVDFFETSRTRKAYVTTPSVMGTQCFVFPICHDAQLYGRVLEVQSARRNLEPELVDTTVMDLVRTEGKIQKKKTKSLSSSSKEEKTEVGGDEHTNHHHADEDEDELGDEEAMWPMDPFLPTYGNEHMQ